MRRTLTLILVLVLALGVMTAPALASQGQGNGQPERAERGNSLVAVADPVDLEPGDVQIETSDPEAVNFEEEFDYAVVHHDVEYDRAVYREPNRLGPDNVELGGSDAGSFWFGVTGPDDDGIQHEIEHTGTVWVYLETDSGWQYLKAVFDDDGELVEVNGVEPGTDEAS